MFRSVFVSPTLLLALVIGCGPATPEAAPHRAALADDQPRRRSVERDRFDRLYVAWRTIVGQLCDLDVQYQTAATQDREQLKRRFERLLAEGAQSQQQIVQAAAVAYAQDPDRNADLAALLTQVVYLLVDQEEYEEALQIAQTLIDGGIQQHDLYTLAGISAFVTAELNLAESHWRRAAEEQKLHGVAARYWGDISYYKAAWEKEKKLRTAEMLAADLPRVLLKTSQGEIELELFQNEAPNTVTNFLWLVEQGFYNGLAFHRVMPRCLAESGCPQGDGMGDPGYTIPNESFRKDHRLHFRGSLAMARAGRDSNGSQFYLTFVPIRRRDGSCTVFGRMVRGIDVLAKLQRREPPDLVSKKLNPYAADLTPPADTIIEAKVLRSSPVLLKQKVYPVPQADQVPRFAQP